MSSLSDAERLFFFCNLSLEAWGNFKSIIPAKDQDTEIKKYQALFSKQGLLGAATSSASAAQADKHLSDNLLCDAPQPKSKDEAGPSSASCASSSSSDSGFAAPLRRDVLDSLARAIEQARDAKDIAREFHHQLGSLNEEDIVHLCQMIGREFQTTFAYITEVQVSINSYDPEQSSMSDGAITSTSSMQQFTPSSSGLAPTTLSSREDVLCALADALKGDQSYEDMARQFHAQLGGRIEDDEVDILENYGADPSASFGVQQAINNYVPESSPILSSSSSALDSGTATASMQSPGLATPSAPGISRSDMLAKLGALLLAQPELNMEDMPKEFYTLQPIEDAERDLLEGNYGASFESCLLAQSAINQYVG